MADGAESDSGQLQNRDGADTESLLLVVGVPRVLLSLFGEDAIAAGARQVADSDGECARAVLDDGGACGGEIVEPVGMDGQAAVGGEKVVDARRFVVRAIN